MSRLECGLGLQAKASSSFGSIKRRAAQTLTQTFKYRHKQLQVCAHGEVRIVEEQEKTRSLEQKKGLRCSPFDDACSYALFARDDFRWFLHRLSMASEGKGSIRLQRFVDMHADLCHVEGDASKHDVPSTEMIEASASAWETVMYT
jgi:hypothetical protein